MNEKCVSSTIATLNLSIALDWWDLVGGTCVGLDERTCLRSLKST